MKKLITLLAVISVVCSSGTYYTRPAKALEAVSLAEYKQQNKAETVFPDPDADYTTVTENDLVFNVYDDYACLYDCKDRSLTEIVIPEEINGVPVTGIANNAPFGFCRNLTSITLPDTLRYFSWEDLCCTTVVTVGSSDSEPVPSVSEVILSDTNPYYTVSDGILYSKDMKTLVGCPPAIDMKSLRISEKAERIGDYAFVSCTGLETAVIPSNIKHINNGAFAGCVNLASAELPESITSISGDMFYFCESLSEVTFNGKIERIGYGAFSECRSLTDFVIPETVTYIGNNAFLNSGCIRNDYGIHYIQNWVVGSDSDIIAATIKDDTKGIAEMSFFTRSKLEFLDVPESVKYTGDLICAGLSSGRASRINYRCSYIGELTFAASKNTTDIYIYDPECDIFDSEKTIPAVYRYTLPDDESSDDDIMLTYIQDENKITGDVVIHGYSGSTAQAYAEKYGRKFELIEDASVSGDANADGLFNVSDVVALQKWLLNVSGTKLTDRKAVDLYADGKIDVFDLCLMKKALIEKNNSDN